MKPQNSNLVVKDNALINASYNLDLVEQRMILLAIVEARKNGQGINANEPLTIHAGSYAQQFGVHRNTSYQALKDACRQLFKREFSYQEIRPKGVAHILSRWVSQVAYLEEDACVQLIFAPAVVPMITALEEQFTSYELEQVSGLNSAYAVRLYELLIAWRKTGKTPVFSIEEFRHKLGVEPHEYLRMDHLKSRVLDASIAQINSQTDIAATYEQHKRGRTISGFSFSFAQKAKAGVERDANTVDMLTGLTDSEAAKPKRKTITKAEAERMARPGEEWPDLLRRITSSHIVLGLKDARAE